MKTCTKCKEEKFLTAFGKSKRTADEKQHHCKACVNAQSKKASLKIAGTTYGKEAHKICSACKEQKPTEDFNNCSSTRDGKMTACRECRKKYHTPKREGILVFSERGERKCTKCDIIKPFSEYYKTDVTQIGVTSVCKDCVVLFREEFKTRVKIKPKNKICTKCKVERPVNSFVKDLSKKDGISSICKPCNNKHKVARSKTDPTFKMSYTIRRQITSAFKNCIEGKFTKNERAEVIIGASFESLKNHIEKQFLPWMTWQKHGNCESNDFNCSFDLDHIIPISYAKTEEEIYILNHWSNFQPLCSKVNRDIKKADVYPCTNLELGITFWEDSWEYISTKK